VALTADIVGFTSLSAQRRPDEVVAMLNGVFTRLDALVDEYGLEKIKTIGDAYMVASGIPTPRDDHAQVLARFALPNGLARSGPGWRTTDGAHAAPQQHPGRSLRRPWPRWLPAADAGPPLRSRRGAATATAEDRPLR
jgi:class 3 adenylate cyclase